MRIGLIDVDGHNFPNLPQMKISAYHKALGDTVERWWGWAQYDKVYMSKVFDDTYGFLLQLWRKERRWKKNLLVI